MDINFEEDWDDEEYENTPEYIFLKNLQSIINKKSYPKKNTRRFIRIAMDMVKNGEISKEDLDNYIENEKINKRIVNEVTQKQKTKKNPYKTVSLSDDPCSSGGSYRSSC